MLHAFNIILKLKYINKFILNTKKAKLYRLHNQITLIFIIKTNNHLIF